MEIENGEAFLSRCKETMRLLELYGRNGRVNENSRVMEMLNDMTPPAPNVDHSKKLLRLLRGIEDMFKNNRGNEMLDGLNPPPRNQFSTPPPIPPAPPTHGHPSDGPPRSGPQKAHAIHNYAHSTNPQPPPPSRHHSSRSYTNPSSYPHASVNAYPHPHSNSHQYPHPPPIPPPPSSADSNGHGDPARYGSRGKGMFVQ